MARDTQPIRTVPLCPCGVLRTSPQRWPAAGTSSTAGSSEVRLSFPFNLELTPNAKKVLLCRSLTVAPGPRGSTTIPSGGRHARRNVSAARRAQSDAVVALARSRGKLEKAGNSLLAAHIGLRPLE